MKVVIAHRDGEPRVVELPEPELGPGDVILRVSHSALMLPQELEVLDNAAAHLAPGQDGIPLGASVSGIVERVGPGVERLKAGLRVCASGRPFVYHAPYLRVPAERVVELPKKVNHEEGSFAGQGAAAVHLVRTAGAVMGASVVVFGAGLGGILAAQAARAGGASVLLADHEEHRLARARNVGVPQTAALSAKALVDEVNSMTAGQGLDAAIVTSDASEAAWRIAPHLLREGGTVVLASSSAVVVADIVIEKELLVRGATGAGRASSGRWTARANTEVFLALLAERKVQVAPLVSDRIPIDRAPSLYEKLRRTQPPSIGAVFTA